MPSSEPGGLLQARELVALLERAGVTRTSVIRLIGPHGLPALLWLCRHGYEDVGCFRPGVGLPHDEEPDAVLVAHTCGEIELKRVLPVARQVRAGGALVFQLRMGPAAEPLAIDWLLEHAGFQPEARFDGERRALIVARRRTVALRRAA
jgi:hypothetical protein